MTVYGSVQHCEQARPIAIIFRGGWGGGGGGVAYLVNQEQILVGMIGHARSEDIRLLEGSGACSPGKSFKFEVLKLKLSIQPSSYYFV